jgi:zinc-finger of a C2HC-type
MQDHDTIREWLKTVPKKLLLSEVGRRNNESRRVYAGGRPKMLKPCPKCGESFGTRDLAKHIPTCS